MSCNCCVPNDHLLVPADLLADLFGGPLPEDSGEKGFAPESVEATMSLSAAAEVDAIFGLLEIGDDTAVDVYSRTEAYKAVLGHLKPEIF